ncbi:MAG: hydantoinase B/oxoprolinase family protein [Deltaproteobacteria bacterium]|nr:hydantoinase B/oxoprolinase family protein [Deltaproteobacteria bacterium]MBW2419353.1 hydantoinase B/oxoprolinase family protein [Deltaproteobacteria bacterium]
MDRGGTFTDCIGRAPDGRLHTAKLLSSDSAPVEGIRSILERVGKKGETGDAAALPPCSVKLGSTVATNALLERRGAPTVLVTNRGLTDLLVIGTQERPELFDLAIERPAPLQREAVGVAGRVGVEGRELEPLDAAAAARTLAAARGRGARSAAVVLIHAYAYPGLEEQLAELARQAGFSYVVASHEIARERGLLARGETTVADAYLTPLLRAHVEHLAAALPGARLRFMQSSGGLTESARFRGPNALLSGPAGGVVAAARVARDAGYERAIGFDMGGTSTDVSLIVDGEVERGFETIVGGIRVKAPMLRIHTVAAGGGSLCRFDGFRLTVGPESAGADPGPLCYGALGEGAAPRGGPLALTDVNFALGRVQPDRFPFELRGEPVARALAALAAELEEAGLRMSEEEIAAGFVEIANASMAQAIAQVSVARGVDPRDHVLVGFGGAGGQHVCGIARRLGIRTVLLHPFAGLLSAYGIGVSELAWDGQRDAGGEHLPRGGGELDVALLERFSLLEAEGRAALAAEGVDAAGIGSERILDLRYVGTDAALSIGEEGEDGEEGEAGGGRGAGKGGARAADAAAWEAAFGREHMARFGYTREDRAIEIVTVRVSCRAPSTGEDTLSGALAGAGEDTLSCALAGAPSPGVAAATPEPLRSERIWFPVSGRRDAPVFERERLAPGCEITGPALVLEDTGTVVIDPGFRARVDERGVLVLHDDELPARPPVPDLSLPDPVRLEVFGNRFMSIAEQMGAVLRNTAVSTNIKERLDYSCAVFDSAGGLVANAPHIPVHLGAMSETVRAVLARFPDLESGDVVVTNDPFEGGSHLPDVTVVTPVFLPPPARPGNAKDRSAREGAEKRILACAREGAKKRILARDVSASRRPAFFVASRGHQADLGGSTPGSMPPDSHTLEDEGVLIEAFRIVRRGLFDEAALRALLDGARYPARRPDDNVSDVEAMVAANRNGVRLLERFVGEQGLETVRVTMQQLQQAAARKVAREIARLPDGVHRFEDRMDDGTPICVCLGVEGERMEIDFEGSGPAVAGNLNAPRAVVQAAVIYVLRALVAERIPLNGGCLEPVTIRIPPGSILDPPRGAAVVGGNVETSQRVVDVLLGALGIAAASQGTMNNVTFGDASFGYYETVGGGAGAGPGFEGASGVHTHMTNTRITDPEILEARYPVRLSEFSLRAGSGGAGRHRGGDGLVRRYTFTAPVTATLLSERRDVRPYGLAGGEPGAAGRNLVERVDGSREVLPGKCSVELAAGDALRIETPGGGGYGDASD